MNADRLLKLANFLDNLPPERFDFTTWVGSDWAGKPDLSCGTTACALGWATTIPEFADAGLCLKRARTLNYSWSYISLRSLPERTSARAAYMDPALVAAKVFGLTEAETWWLFTPRGHEERFESYDARCPDHRPSELAGPRDVAAHIRDFIQNGIPDWADEGGA